MKWNEMTFKNDYGFGINVYGEWKQMEEEVTKQKGIQQILQHKIYVRLIFYLSFLFFHNTLSFSLSLSHSLS